ncbi:MAG: hypothetical protein QW299_08975 [Candidatus Caldarchaeum sp.]
MEQDIRKDAEQQLASSLDEFISEFVLPSIQMENETEIAPTTTESESVEVIAENTNETDTAVDEILSLLLVDDRTNEQEVASDANEKEEVQEVEVTDGDEETEVTVEETEDEENIEAESEVESDDEDDWLSSLLGKTKAEEKAEEKAEKKSTKEPTKSVPKAKPENPELQELKKQVESLTQLSQFLLASVQLEQWIEETAKSALQMQEKLAQYGIQLTEDEISQAMLRASSRALQDSQAFTKEIRPIVAKKMAQQVTRNRRIPSQPQEAALARRESFTSNQPQDILQKERHSFEEFVLETLDEIKRRTGQ